MTTTIAATPAPLPPSLGGEAPPCRRCGSPMRKYNWPSGQKAACLTCRREYQKGWRMGKKLGINGYVPTPEQIRSAAARIKSDRLATLRASMGGKHGEPSRPRVYRAANYWDATRWDAEA